MSEEKALTLVQRLALRQNKESSDPVINAVLQKVTAKYRTLLLDFSYSMDESVGDGSYKTKVQALREIIREFPNTRKFSFGTSCSEGVWEQPSGGTNMALAFETVKNADIREIVLITDGMPDSEEAALRAAQGLKIDIVYVGPQPSPPFLARLAQVTGGTFGAGSLAEPKLLTEKVKQLLLGVKK